ncbi:BamA/TamA family outer membrane protein [Carboxylicivirga mesophila]|uniref:BamA/TamA family outer membrane protein n=1 Tax=Carboxylicivirga mesophila TaxID=1166478 RepID=A0ABS5KEQ4_9BACT|nr:BamA/TamA family outer membrane protein [Carboxylicivirga mesophila]MBS2213539.1 BamA/TamA family outer membrane protein [Carboxylicivirga mesophila]
MKTLVTLIFLYVASYCIYGQELLKVKKVSFKGNNAISSSRLEEELTIKTSGKTGERFFNKEADRFTMPLYEDNKERIKYAYQKEGFLNVTFDEPKIKVTSGKRVKIIYNINEGEPVKLEEVTYTVDSIDSFQQFFSKKTQRKIRLQSQLKVNKPFRDEWFFADQAFINDELNNMGYAYARVKHQLVVDTLKNMAYLEWIIKKDKLTYFGNITVEGNERVPTKNVVKQLRFEPGDVWSKYEIDESQKQIYNLGMFRVASIKTLITDDKPDTLSTLVVLKEAPRLTSRFGVGYGSEDKFRVFGDVQYLSVITKTGRVNLFAKHSALEPYNFQLNFIQPAVVFPFNSLNINPYFMKQHEPAYRVTRQGLNLTLLQHFTDRFNSSVNFYLEEVNSDSVLVTTQARDMQYDQSSSYSKSGVAIGFVFSNGTPRLDPVTGYSLAVNIKRNGTIIEESVPFYRSLVEYKKYLGISQGVTLAFKGKMGLAFMSRSDDLVPVEERFYAGGSYSVRGWARAQLGPKDGNGQPLGGNSLLEGSIEWRYLLSPKVVLALFGDAGNVWQNSFDYRLNDLHYAAGFGIRFKTPIGPVGLDFARPVFEQNNTWQIHFNIGNPF